MKSFWQRKSDVSSRAPICCCLVFFMLNAPSVTEALNYPDTPDNDPWNSTKWELLDHASDGGAQCSRAGSIVLHNDGGWSWFGHNFSDTPIEAGAEITFNFEFYCDTGGLGNYWVELWDEVQGVTRGAEEFTSTAVCTSKSITVTATGSGDSFATYIESGQAGTTRYCWFTNVQITGEPTLVTLSTFTGARHGTRVIITWETAAELDTVGFNIWRSDTEDGEYEKINATLIPSEGGPVEGASYEFVNEDCVGTCFYKLEDIDTSGEGTFHGPVQVEPALPLCGTMSEAKGMSLIWLFALPALAILWLSRRQRKGQSVVGT